MRTTKARTKKFSLLIALLLAFVAMLGIGFIAMPKTAHAADSPLVTQFEANIDAFSDLSAQEKLTKAELAKEENAALWPKYIAAKMIYASSMSADERNAIAPEKKTIYETIDAIFSPVYDIYVRDMQMSFVAHPGATHPVSYTNNTEVEAILKAQTELADQDLLRVLNSVTDELALTKAAQAEMNKLKTDLNFMKELMSTIYYFEGTLGSANSGVWKNTGYTAAADQYIVLGSERSIDLAQAEIDAYEKKTVDKVADLDYTKDAYATFAEAKKALDTNKALADPVVAAINNIQVKPSKTYYTKKGEIEAARKAFDELNTKYAAMVDGVNKNDLQSLPVAEKKKLEEMEKYCATVKGKIDAVIGLIDKLPATKDAKYTDDYLKLIKDAEDAFSGLDEDIQNHDINFDPKTAAKGDDYIVKAEGGKSYGDLKAARAQYDAWDTAVKNLENDLAKQIALYLDKNAHVNVSAAVNDINATYLAFTSEQKQKFQKDKVPTWKEGVEAPSYYTAMTTILAEITQKYNKISDIDKRIESLYAGNKYQYKQRDVFTKLWADYQARLAEYPDDDLSLYASHLPQLLEMQTTYEAADAAVKAWMDAVNNSALMDKTAVRVTLDKYALATATKTLYDALAKNTEGQYDYFFTDIQDVVKEGTGLTDDKNETLKKADVTAAFTKYNTIQTQVGVLDGLVKRLEGFRLEQFLPGCEHGNRELEESEWHHSLRREPQGILVVPHGCHDERSEV